MSYLKHRNKKNLKDKTYTGTVQGTERGFVFILPDEDVGHDFFVPRKSINGAYHGDKVLFGHVRGTDDEGYVLKIIERGNPRIVGTFIRDRRLNYVYPDNPRLPKVFIPQNLAMNAKNGDKVVSLVTAYPKGKAPEGKIAEILGKEGDFEAEELSIIRSYGLEEEFPEPVAAEAKKVSKIKISPEGVKDLRNLNVITIDGEDTRDIDDGISIKFDGANYILGVHIADVGRYVLPRSALDKNAYERGTSVYFPDRVLPMLPKELSNGACSLNEGEDRYAMSCIMTIDGDGRRKNCEICESIIQSKHRMTYNEVTAILGGDRQLSEKYADVADDIKIMEKLCLILENRRERRGAVTLDVKEAHIYVNDSGEIVIPDAERTISQRVIEQFMVSANEAVAEFLLKRNAPCLYRIHESPSPEKTGNFFSFLRDLGVKPQTINESPEPRDFQKILKDCEDKPYYSIVNKVMLRSMQKARYSEENAGHFGLASDCYCHFTSPIRRYPDLFVHRSLKEILHGGNPSKLYNKIAHEAGDDCSQRERLADECERKVDDLYKLAYMSERLGEEYDAVISGVTAFGVFCELENTIEGLIPIEDLPEDEYVYYENKFLLKGNKRAFSLGEKLRVKVADCDLGRLRVFFKLCDKVF